MVNNELCAPSEFLEFSEDRIDVMETLEYPMDFFEDVHDSSSLVADKVFLLLFNFYSH